MNTKRLLISFGLLVLTFTAGCSGQPAASQVGDAANAGHENHHRGTQQGVSQGTPDIDHSTPASIVGQFLQALRSGDREVAENLLTQKAREETAKRDLTVQPPGSPEIEFEIGATEFLDEQQNAAHVVSVWSEPSSDGTLNDYEIVWALRRQHNGWRVAGMATRLAPDQPAIFLNFEDPDDMFAKWEAADRIAREQMDPSQATSDPAQDAGQLR